MGPETANDGEALLENVGGPGGIGVGDRAVGGARQLLLHGVEPFEELAGRSEAVGDLGARRLFHESPKPLGDPVGRGREVQAMALGEDPRQLEGAFGGGRPGKEPVGEGAEGEDVEEGPFGRRVGSRFGGDVGARSVVDELGDVFGAGDAATRGARRVAQAGLPVEDLHPRLGDLRVEDEEALRAESPVGEAVLVGVLEGFCDLPEELETGVER